jgi:hypothetical protein
VDDPKAVEEGEQIVGAGNHRGAVSIIRLIFAN